MENIGAVYAARVSMAKSDIQVGDKQVQLSPGMNVTVEVKTGTRRLIEYFLSPLLRGGVMEKKQEPVFFTKVAALRRGISNPLLKILSGSYLQVFVSFSNG